MHGLALAEHAADRHGIEHPVLDRVFFEDFSVADVVFEAVLLVAFDVDAEHVLDGIFMAVKGAANHWQAFRHVVVHPLAVDILKRDSFGAVNGVYKPDVLLEEGVGFHNF